MADVKGALRNLLESLQAQGQITSFSIERSVDRKSVVVRVVPRTYEHNPSIDPQFDEPTSPLGTDAGEE
jgi:hypothetical protein